MNGLPREVSQAKACAELARVARRETTTPTRRKPPAACSFCFKTWFDFEKRIPALSFSRVDGMLFVDCACCNSRRTISMRGRS